MVTTRDTLKRNLSKELVLNLEALFPTVDPRPGMTMDEIMFASGQNDVVRFLRKLYEESQENILELTDVP